MGQFQQLFTGRLFSSGGGQGSGQKLKASAVFRVVSKEPPPSNRRCHRDLIVRCLLSGGWVNGMLSIIGYHPPSQKLLGFGPADMVLLNRDGRP
jgi:hypothetical protein